MIADLYQEIYDLKRQVSDAKDELFRTKYLSKDSGNTNFEVKTDKATMGYQVQDDFNVIYM